MADSEVKALIFDVFGTVVDWRSSIIKHGKDFGRIHGVEADWDAFADAWRSKYSPYMNKVRTGELPWTNLDALHRMALEDVLGEFKITGIRDEA
ncbi:MAG: haloacid dehalogenase type II, partial [Chloroflexi bacterium]|nr:haloacid dehalogenase type II [Chloroflexota bacterium]